MPAINLARLKIQAARLLEKSAEPEVFIHELNDMLDFYTNRTIRATQVVRQLSLPTYHTPRPVLRQIENELDILAEKHPPEALHLVEALWKARSLQSRLLAAHLLGRLPSDLTNPIFNLLPDWLDQSSDRAVRMALLTDGLAHLRRERPDTYFNILEGWLTSPLPVVQIWGLQALIPLLQDPRFENLPAVFRILRPAIQAANPAIQLDLQACLAALERVSLTETIAFLREILRDDPRPAMLRLFRRVLPGLTPDLQESLRAILREQEKPAPQAMPR